MTLPFVAADDGIAARETTECFNPNSERSALNLSDLAGRVVLGIGPRRRPQP